jgi:hypothetical protein
VADFKRGDGKVTFTLTEDQFALLMMAIGMALGSSYPHPISSRMLALANAINEGNPDWTPYELKKPEASRDLQTR